VHEGSVHTRRAEKKRERPLLTRQRTDDAYTMRLQEREKRPAAYHGKMSHISLISKNGGYSKKKVKLGGGRPLPQRLPLGRKLKSMKQYGIRQ